MFFKRISAFVQRKDPQAFTLVVEANGKPLSYNLSNVTVLATLLNVVIMDQTKEKKILRAQVARLPAQQKVMLLLRPIRCKRL